LTINKGTLTLSTLILDSGGGAVSNKLGESVYDTASLSGATAGFTPTIANVAYTFNSAAAGSGAQSTTEGPLAAGSYSFSVTFSGDSNYNAITTPVVESLTINKGTPTVTVTDGGVYNGSAFNAVGSATGVGGVAVTGTFIYTYYASNGTTQLTSAPTSVGSYYVTAAFTSTNSNYSNASSAKTAFSITAPVVTNPGTQNNADGDAVSLQIRASTLSSGDSWTYTATGLPASLSINKTTGVISGTVTGSAKPYSATVTATDSHSVSASASFTWNVTALSITTPTAQNNAVGDSVSLSISASGLPSGDSWTYAATGLSINASTGVISGTITAHPARTP